MTDNSSNDSAADDSSIEAPAVLMSFHPGWAQITLNRPQRKNAIDGMLGRQLAHALDEVALRVRAQNDIKAVVLCGADGAFCSGLDISAFNAEPAPDWVDDFQSIWRGAHRGLFNCPVPIIGALERYAINGGAALALACDLLVVGEGSFLQVGEIQIGMAAPYNLVWLALRQSEVVAAQLVLEGERWYGPKLLDTGIATYCVPDAEVLVEAQALATKLAGFKGSAHGQIKAGLRAGLNVDADEWFDRFTANVSRVKPASMR